MIISVKMLGTAFPTKNASVLIHLGLTVLSQKPLMGRQEKIETKTIAIHQAMTTAPTIDDKILNSATAKILR